MLDARVLHAPAERVGPPAVLREERIADDQELSGRARPQQANRGFDERLVPLAEPNAADDPDRGLVGAEPELAPERLARHGRAELTRVDGVEDRHRFRPSAAPAKPRANRARVADDPRREPGEHAVHVPHPAVEEIAGVPDHGHAGQATGDACADIRLGPVGVHEVHAVGADQRAHAQRGDREPRQVAQPTKLEGQDGNPVTGKRARKRAPRRPGEERADGAAVEVAQEQPEARLRPAQLIDVVQVQDLNRQAPPSPCARVARSPSSAAERPAASPRGPATRGRGRSAGAARAWRRPAASAAL